MEEEAGADRGAAGNKGAGGREAENASTCLESTVAWPTPRGPNKADVQSSIKSIDHITKKTDQSEQDAENLKTRRAQKPACDAINHMEPCLTRETNAKQTQMILELKDSALFETNRSKPWKI